MYFSLYCRDRQERRVLKMETGLPATLTNQCRPGVSLGLLKVYAHPLFPTYIFNLGGEGWGTHSIQEVILGRSLSQLLPTTQSPGSLCTSVGPSLRFRCSFSWLDDLSQVHCLLKGERWDVPSVGEKGDQ